LSLQHKKKIFTLKELAIWFGHSRASVAMGLIRAKRQSLVFSVNNFWFNQLDPPTLEQLALTIKSPSYISFESALNHHGIVSQAPQGQLTLATCGRSSTVHTPIGQIGFAHVKSELFFGFDDQQMATAEKAFLDLIYLRTKKGMNPLFTETIYFEQLNQQKLKTLARKYPSWVYRKYLLNRTSPP
ncbi:MAG: Transcriptional regulator protein-like protein, partial [uncultured bacterium]